MARWSGRFVVVLCLCGLITFCSEPPKQEEAVPEGMQPPPLGSWIMYGSDSRMLTEGRLNEEETVLVLSDSSYSLTFKRPSIKFMFVESGKVYYDLRAKIARFTVASTSGFDFSSGVPRKLALIPESVPFQRDPGTLYGLNYSTRDSLMSLSGEGMATSWFIRMSN